MGWLTEEEKEQANSYFKTQLINYSEEKALEHIRLHLDENDQKHIHSVFADTIDLQEVFDTAKIRITYLNSRSTTLVDKYQLKLNHSIGQINRKETDSIEVITFVNKKNILTMYPIYPVKLDEKFTEKEKQKKKTIPNPNIV